jgi:hypothetical protein
MKKYILVSLLLSLLFNFSGDAQKGQNNRKKDQIESLRVAFLTQKLSLSPDEAALFWPIYNEMNDKISGLKKSTRLEIRQTEVENEADAKELLQMKLDAEQKELDIRKLYINKLINAVSARKIVLLGLAEDQFKRELIKEMRNRQN